MEIDNLAPIVLFVYKRADTLRKAIEALQQNPLAKSSDLIVYSDAAKSSKDEKAIAEVRAFLKTISGFKTLRIVEADTNKGLAASIIQGVSETLEKYGQAIVLEDDLVTSTNFLAYMNSALNHYQSNPEVFSISGFSMPIKGLQDKDVFFTFRGSSWGWATWADRWKHIDWETKDYQEFKNNAALRNQFNQMGSDMAGMLDRQLEGKINSWAIRFNYHQFVFKKYSVHPAISKVINIGFAEGATHTNDKFDRFKTYLDTSGKTKFEFPDHLNLDKKVIAQFVRPYSIFIRIKHKLLNLLPI